MIVLDASAAVEILLGSEVGARVLDRLESHSEVHVPEHFHIEAISALRRYALRGELDGLRVARSLEVLRELRAVRYPVIDLVEEIWGLREQLSAYDAAYLALARRLELSLISADGGLAGAARAEGRLAALDSPSPLTPADVERLRECILAGGVAVFPADTVYGLACDPANQVAVAKLYELKGRPPERPAALMFFSLPAALAALPELGERERAALRALLPAPFTLLLPNRRHRFPLAGGGDTLGLRVPRLPEQLAALAAVDVAVMQSSANLSGGPEARRLEEIPRALRDGVDLVLDGGELPGVASTVLDLREYETAGRWRIVRAGPVGDDEVRKALI